MTGISLLLPPPHHLRDTHLYLVYIISYLHHIISGTLIFDRFISSPTSSISSQGLSSLKGIRYLLPSHHLRDTHLYLVYIISTLLHIISETLIFIWYISSPTSALSSQGLSSLKGISLLLPPPHHQRDTHLYLVYIISTLLHIISGALIFDRYKSPPASSPSSQRHSSLFGIYHLHPPPHHLRDIHLYLVYIISTLLHIISETLIFIWYISSPPSSISSQGLSSLTGIYLLPPPHHLSGSHLC